MVNSKQLLKIDFTTFILSISSAAFMGLGVSPHGESGESNWETTERQTTGVMDNKIKVDLELARQNIDLLELIYEKTKGNRTVDEDRLMEQLLFETRMRYVEVTRNQGK